MLSFCALQESHLWSNDLTNWPTIHFYKEEVALLCLRLLDVYDISVTAAAGEKAGIIHSNGYSCFCLELQQKQSSGDEV